VAFKIRFAPYTELQDTALTLFVHDIVELFGTIVVCWKTVWIDINKLWL